MTKLEYMQYVREKLQGYDREFVEEILENYEEHFEAGLKNGRSEEEICEELGNIESLLGDIQDVMGDKDLKTHEIDQFTAIEQPQESYSGIEEIDLSLLSMDVQILPSRDGQLHVYLRRARRRQNIWRRASPATGILRGRKIAARARSSWGLLS